MRLLNGSVRRGHLHVVLVGLEFGAEFAPIYQVHPDVATVGLCDISPSRLASVGDRFGIERRYASLAEVLADSTVDAVHLVTPVTDHAAHTLAVLEAGRHCACTIPMAMAYEDLRKIIDVREAVDRVYMMMETAVYTREFLYVQELVRRGDLGRIAFARGAHLQDMEGWPAYWAGFPPLAHITHALSPVLALLGTRATKVHCFGSGALPAHMRAQYGNPYPVETAIFQLEGSDVAVEVTRSMFQMARAYTEAFAIYGDRLGFEWPQLEEEQPLLFEMAPAATRRGRAITAQRLQVPDRADLLPAEIARFTQRGVYGEGEHLSFIQGGGHGGSHPHLVHEFVRSIVEERTPAINDITAANWTAAGIAAHESAMRGGEGVQIPTFDKQRRTPERTGDAVNPSI
jgi:predicted dehydrogenase